VSAEARAEVARRCEVIEEAYEFMLAYAAQGVSGDATSQSGGQIREWLIRALTAMDGLAASYRAIVEDERLDPRDALTAFIDVLDRDARASQAAYGLVIGQPRISSQLVDNLNASIHVRALLTDLFLIDEALAASSTRPI
jgi:hypothetical protein